MQIVVSSYRPLLYDEAFAEYDNTESVRRRKRGNKVSNIFFNISKIFKLGNKKAEQFYIFPFTTDILNAKRISAE